MQKLTIGYIIDFKSIIIAIGILFIFLLAIFFQLKIYIDTNSVGTITDGYGYYSGDKVEQIKNSKEITVTPTLPFDTDLTMDTLPASSNDLAVAITTLDYLNAPETAFSENMSYLENGNQAQTFPIILSPFSNELSNFQVGLDSFDARELFAGKYPASDDQIVIPINLALKLANDRGYKQYEDVVGDEISFKLFDKDVSKTISGVIGGSNIIMQSKTSSAPDDENALIIHFDNEKTISELEKKYNIDIITNADLKLSVPKIIYIETFIALILYFYMAKPNIKKAYEVLEFHSYNSYNNILIYCSMAIPIITILLILKLI